MNACARVRRRENERVPVFVSAIDKDCKNEREGETEGESEKEREQKSVGGYKRECACVCVCESEKDRKKMRNGIKISVTLVKLAHTGRIIKKIKVIEACKNSYSTWISFFSFHCSPIFLSFLHDILTSASRSCRCRP